MTTENTLVPSKSSTAPAFTFTVSPSILNSSEVREYVTAPVPLAVASCCTDVSVGEFSAKFTVPGSVSVNAVTSPMEKSVN